MRPRHFQYDQFDSFMNRWVMLLLLLLLLLLLFLLLLPLLLVKKPVQSDPWSGW